MSVIAPVVISEIERPILIFHCTKYLPERKLQRIKLGQVVLKFEIMCYH